MLNSTPRSIDLRVNDTELLIDSNTSSRVIANYSDRSLEDVTQPSTLTSSNSSVASITENGTITANSDRQTTVTAACEPKRLGVGISRGGRTQIHFPTDTTARFVSTVIQHRREPYSRPN
ncbi:MAG: Ig-like domain-containing protein [Natrialbaceae archaeon]|nr:Ig-like domain-containing protein [Natrialbaceae archaeon]